MRKHTRAYGIRNTRCHVCRQLHRREDVILDTCIWCLWDAEQAFSVAARIDALLATFNRNSSALL